MNTRSHSECSLYFLNVCDIDIICPRAFWIRQCLPVPRVGFMNSNQVVKYM